MKRKKGTARWQCFNSAKDFQLNKAVLIPTITGFFPPAPTPLSPPSTPPSSRKKILTRTTWTLKLTHPYPPQKRKGKEKSKLPTPPTPPPPIPPTRHHLQTPSPPQKPLTNPPLPPQLPQLLLQNQPTIPNFVANSAPPKKRNRKEDKRMHGLGKSKPTTQTPLPFKCQASPLHPPSP